MMVVVVNNKLGKKSFFFHHFVVVHPFCLVWSINRRIFIRHHSDRNSSIGIPEKEKQEKKGFPLLVSIHGCLKCIIELMTNGGRGKKKKKKNYSLKSNQNLHFGFPCFVVRFLVIFF